MIPLVTFCGVDPFLFANGITPEGMSRNAAWRKNGPEEIRQERDTTREVQGLSAPHLASRCLTGGIILEELPLVCVFSHLGLTTTRAPGGRDTEKPFIAAHKSG